MSQGSSALRRGTAPSTERTKSSLTLVCVIQPWKETRILQQKLGGLLYWNYSNMNLLLKLKLQVDFFHSMAYIHDIEYVTTHITEDNTVLNKRENWQGRATEPPAPITPPPGWCCN